MSITMQDFDEYYEGRRAFADGYGEDENPYPYIASRVTRQSPQYLAWQGGWYAAEAGK